MVLFGGIMRRREVAAESRGRSEGIAEGRSEGIAEGLAQANKKWQEWNRRRLEAEAAGHPFTEPPPSDPLSENKAEGGE